MIELSDIVGQDAAIGRLGQALTGRRRPHAYLFVGPGGVGRRTSAIAFARVLLCGQADSATPQGLRACGQCENCRLQAVGSHPDFHLVHKELAKYHDDPQVRSRVMQGLSIDVIRSFLIAPSARSASRGRGKVFVVLEAELMSPAAQNALLKTLEEPPADVTIILICRQAEAMLPTTRSRCSIVRFGLLPRQFVAGRLIEAGVGADEAGFWAGYTGGSLGQALRLARQGFYDIKRDVLSRLAAMGPAGNVDFAEHLAGVMDNLAKAAVAEVKKADGTDLSKMLASRRAAGAMLELIGSAYRDAMHLAAGAECDLVHTDQGQAVQALAQRFEPGQLADVIEQLSEYERLLWRNVNPRIVWDNVVITCASAAPLKL